MGRRFETEHTLEVLGDRFRYHRMDVVEREYPDAATLPYSLRILLEGLLRNDDGSEDCAGDIEALAQWQPGARREINFTPSRVLLQDFTGVPAVVDLAAMRDAMLRLGGDPKKINPLQPVDLVIDHSVQVDAFGNDHAFAENVDLEYLRNRERYAFLRWGQRAFDNFCVVPPGTGIVHQVNLEHLASVVFVKQTDGTALAYPDTLVGTDSHSTMINGLGVLGWGVGGIEAEAAMLGQPVAMMIPEVVGFELTGALAEDVTATDLVLTATEILRREGVVGAFVEFHGEGIGALRLADRATLANMAPEFGATCAFFPVDELTLEYLRLTGRPPSSVALVEAYCRAQGLFRSDRKVRYGRTIALDLSAVERSVAGPARPQDRLPIARAADSVRGAIRLHQSRGGRAVAEKDLARLRGEGGGQTAVGAEEAAVETPLSQRPSIAGGASVSDGSVVIAAITSCTNTSNPSVMLAAGLLARKAIARGLRSKPWVKTSLAPGSQVVTDYLGRAGLLDPLQALGFHLVGYGCTTCIGNSGPLSQEIAAAIRDRDLTVCAVLSGNRNFEGRVHPLVRANYLASPPLVVAYALAGRMDIDLTREPLGADADGQPVYLHELWPTREAIEELSRKHVHPSAFAEVYAHVFEGEERWHALAVDGTPAFQWDPDSTYVRRPPFFDAMTREVPKPRAITAARALLLLGDSITTDHISPAGAIDPSSPAGKYLRARGVEPAHFNSYGSRRGNDEVMVRGTFGNPRIRNLAVPDSEGPIARYYRAGASETLPIYDAAMRYREDGVPLIVIAGSDYGAGSSRDWAAKGPMLLGVRAVIAESFERIHRSNLIGMGILPLQFGAGDDAVRLGLTGEETYTVEGHDAAIAPGQAIVVRARRPDGIDIELTTRARIDTPQEAEYYRHGGVLHFVLRQLLA